MIPIEKFRDSSFYKMILDEGREEGREEGIAETLLLLIKGRFPKLNVRRQVKSIKNAEVLKRLFVDVMKLKDEEALTKRLQAALKESTPAVRKTSKRRL